MKPTCHCRRFFSAFFLLLSAVSFAGANSDGIGTTGAAFLRINPMARPAGMGNAYTGLAEGIESLYFNPAGLTTIEKWDAGLAGITMPFDATLTHFSVGRRMSKNSVLALYTTYLGAEDEQRDNRGVKTGTFTNWDLAIGVSGAYSLSRELSVGGTMRLIQSSLAGYDATAFGVDGGVKYRPLRWPGVSLGLAFRNLGTGLKFISSSSPQPFEVRIGGAFEPSHKKFVVSGDLALDAEVQPRANIGAEYHITKNFSVRSGFDIGYDVNFTRALRLGMGFHSRVGSFDYSFQTRDEIGNDHRFSYSYLGGRPPAPDTQGIFSRWQLGLRSQVKVAVLPFINLSPTEKFDWLSEGFREIFFRRLSEEDDFVMTEKKDARYLIEGRYSAIGEESIWIGVKIIDAKNRTVVEFVENTILQSDLIEASRNLAATVADKVPGR
ncbi:MAG: hypothetical protein D6679_01065 [Candidatus Hydrogenedentota bacterium]|nr:MAG: hypothetical protein D6679_01065 [Candidatus Hydrogenedentota bacterium]